MDEDTELTADAPEAAVTPDISAFEAKITELTQAVIDRDAIIADRDAKLVAAKAANYDLLMSVPNETDEQDIPVDEETSENDGPDIDDLFDPPQPQ